MHNPHERDLRPADVFEYEQHATGCPCDVCTETFEPDYPEPVPSQAELERRYQYFLHGKVS